MDVEWSGQRQRWEGHFSLYIFYSVWIFEPSESIISLKFDSNINDLFKFYGLGLSVTFGVLAYALIKYL